MKVLINRCFGGFGFNDKFINHCKESGITEFDRGNPFLIALAESYDGYIGSDCSNLEIVEFVDGLSYSVSEYDGYESLNLYIKVSKEELINGLPEEKISWLIETNTIIYAE